MSFSASSWFPALAILTIVAFCFWKPDFPKRVAPKLGVRGERGTTIFLVIYWITIPVIIHRLMAAMWAG